LVATKAFLDKLRNPRLPTGRERPRFEAAGALASFVTLQALARRRSEILRRGMRDGGQGRYRANSAPANQ
jgi:hypothetical protein